MIPTDVGEGLGQIYRGDTRQISEVAFVDHHGYTVMRERVMVRRVAEKRVTILVRDRVRPEHPYLNLVRASAYTYQYVGSPFPVPPLRRETRLPLVKRRQTI